MNLQPSHPPPPSRRARRPRWPARPPPPLPLPLPVPAPAEQRKHDPLDLLLHARPPPSVSLVVEEGRLGDVAQELQVAAADEQRRRAGAHQQMRRRRRGRRRHGEPPLRPGRARRACRCPTSAPATPRGPARRSPPPERACASSSTPVRRRRRRRQRRCLYRPAGSSCPPPVPGTARPPAPSQGGRTGARPSATPGRRWRS